MNVRMTEVKAAALWLLSGLSREYEIKITKDEVFK